MYYSTPQELIQYINYYLYHNDERCAIGKEGREYCLKYHTFSDRVREVLSLLERKS